MPLCLCPDHGGVCTRPHEGHASSHLMTDHHQTSSQPLGNVEVKDYPWQDDTFPTEPKNLTEHAQNVCDRMD